MKYQPPTGAADPNDPYVGRNLGAGIQGSRVPPKAIEHHMRELVALITKSGLTPSEGDLEQVLKSVRSQNLNYRTASGTANALTIALDPIPAAWADLTGVPLRIKIGANANTGAATIAITGLSGTKAIVRPNGDALKAGDLQIGSIKTMVYDGTAFQISSVIEDRPGQFILLQRILINPDVASVDWAIPTGFDFLRVSAFLKGSTAPVNMRISKDNGTSYLAGASDYSAGFATVNSASTWGVSSGANSSVLQLCDLFDSDANGFSTSVVMFHRGGAALKPQSFGSSYGSTSFGLKSAHFMSRTQANGLATNIRFLASTGNMLTGSQIVIEGLKP